MPAQDEALATFTAEEAIAVAQRLEESDSVVLVGGQSLNFWAERFFEADAELAQLVPFESHDIDFLGSLRDARSCAERLGGKWISPPLEAVATPEVGIVECTINGKELRIDFLGFMAGVGTPQARATAIRQDIGQGVTLRVLHPLAILQSRLSNIYTLHRRDRLALRQMRASICVLRQFVKAIAAEDPRTALDLIEDVFDIACSLNGRKLWLEHGVDIFAAIETCPGLPQDFTRQRLPRMRAEIAHRRERYRQNQLAVANRKRRRRRA